MAGLFQTGFVVTDSGANPIDGVSDVLIREINGRIYMVVGSEALGAISVYDVTDPGSIALTGRVEYSAQSGTATLSDLVLTPDGQILALGRYDDNYALYDISPGGAISLSESYFDATLAYTGGLVGEAASVNGETLIYTANFNQTGFEVYTLGNSGALTPFASVEDTGWRRLEDVSALHHATLHGQDALFVASAFDSGIHIYTFSASGSARQAERILPEHIGGFARVTAMDSIQVNERGFMIVGASQSDSISVIRISQNNVAKLVDHRIDTKALRFEGLQDLEAFSIGDRSFVVAAGADDGVSLFELNYRGRLMHIDTIADDFDTTLRNISSLDVRVEGETAYIYVGSASEHGVTELVIDLSRSGVDLRGAAAPEVLRGTNGDDIIWGMGRSDQISGLAGDDILVDGRGRDTLTGGRGKDVFKFIDDGRSDFITDFNPRHDKIDLTDFDFVNHIDDLTIGARERGAAIIVGDEVIRLYNPAGGPYNMDLFTEDNFIFG
ncbi:hypothetical protein [Oceanibium sediminis]|uniref:hypothetical protein n=1 Tax=Oceanibium sediminis TaxID=2026339 RepID=UPI000DD44C18|nr:hypothetical protein [Oceanibium sediminis]